MAKALIIAGAAAIALLSSCVFPRYYGDAEVSIGTDLHRARDPTECGRCANSGQGVS
jgi:hypothetical protein